MHERTIFLVRHGTPQLPPDNEKRYIGQTDLPLSEEGLRQAANLRAKLAGEKIGSIYCSDLLRTKQTAEIIAADRDVKIVELEGLREINLADWEGRTFTEIERLYPEDYKSRGEDIVNFRVPGGESFAECNQRVLSAFEDILQASRGNILIVGHAGINRLILCHVLGVSIRHLLEIDQDYACLCIIRQSHSKLWLEREESPGKPEYSAQALNDEGFLENYNDWSLGLALYFSSQDGVELTGDKWEILLFTRNYFKRYRISPMPKIIVKCLNKASGFEKYNIKRLFSLFPPPASRTICLYSGIPQPAGCT